MSVTRRALLGSTLLAAAPAVIPMTAMAQDATAVAERPDAPGYGILRIRVLSTPELNQAAFPDVMYQFLPPTAAIPGYFGYLFAFDSSDPSAAITLTLLADAEAGAQADKVSEEYVAGLDPRMIPETPLDEQGPMRIYHLTDRLASELPPHLSGCYATFRHRINAADTDVEGLVQAISDDLVPTLSAMDGFVLYGWLQTPDGRISMNIWETAEQLEAGDQAVADWVAVNPIVTSQGDPTVYAGEIGYADVLGG